MNRHRTRVAVMVIQLAVAAVMAALGAYVASVAFLLSGVAWSYVVFVESSRRERRRAAPSDDPAALPGEASIVVSRRRGGLADRARSYVVQIDGVTVGRLSDGESGDYPVTAGRHRLQLRIDWTTSRPFNVDLAFGETARFRCSPRHALLGWYWAFLGWRRYIKLEVESTAPASVASP
ncbi:MAG: hypothetical protein AAGC46_00450 [Solirubrobacteraceae bacterium]|nr:hypothetical protein [Patulibacter sp.]